MKSKKMTKALAMVMSATMAMGMSATAFAVDATDPEASVDAPIYSFDVINVVVPTALKVAFNPDELIVEVDDAGTTSTEQVLSHNFGILNKSSKDKVVTVALTVTDKNAYADDAAEKITFVDAADDATGAEKGKYAIYLAAAPADATEVQVGSTPADKDTEAVDLANVKMVAATANAVALSAGDNEIAFVLEKAKYEPKQGSGIVLGTAAGNNVQANYEITGVAEDSKGITAFSFTGAMNKKADWTKLQSGIEIKAVYTFANADGETAITGTGAMIELSSAPKFTASATPLTIDYTAGVGDKGLQSIDSIIAKWGTTEFDIYNASTNPAWTAATKTDSMITFASTSGITGFAGAPDATNGKLGVTVNYTDNAGNKKSAVVDVLFKTGS